MRVPSSGWGAVERSGTFPNAKQIGGRASTAGDPLKIGDQGIWALRPPETREPNLIRPAPAAGTMDLLAVTRMEYAWGFGAMYRHSIGSILVMGATVLWAISTFAQDVPPTSTGYLTPPQVIIDIVDAPPTPAAVVSPAGDVVAFTQRRSLPPISELAKPMHRLAGLRINPRNNAPWQTPAIDRIVLTHLEDGTEHEILAPLGTTLAWVRFSPDGAYLSYAVIRDTGVELWVVETASGIPRPLTSASLNATWGNPCDWLADSSGVLCTFLMSARGAPPTPSDAPAGPNIQDNRGQFAPVRTYQDLLANAHDEALFEYHFTNQLATVQVATGSRRNVGRPGLFARASAAPDGQYVLVVRLKPPFSRQVPAGRFSRSVEIWNRAGDLVHRLADLPVANAVPIGGVPTGPRGHRWNPSRPATVVWSEAQDGGDPRATVMHRDHVFRLDAPFDTTPQQLIRTEFRFSDISWTENGVALVNEYDRRTRWRRTWLLYPEGAGPRRLWDQSAEDRYADPGTPVRRPGGGVASRMILQNGDYVLLHGQGASPLGDKPFLDRLNLTTLRTERIFQTEDTVYERVIAPLTGDGRRLLTRRESPTEPPNYFLRDGSAGTSHALTDYGDPAPVLRQVRKQVITYERADGVALSATLYLPPAYQDGDRPPMLMWAYPREYTNADVAGQVRGSQHRFTSIRGSSHLLLLTQGYAVLDGPTMPIVGEGETANDTYIEQLVSSAEAAVEAVVGMGVADRDRIAIGGHSYGAFMAANLLAHSDLFRAGIARSGAFNRTLTPFGFQNERRTFWDVPNVYGAMSPFFHADKVNEPILLTHGEADNNSGTFPIQSERFYMALKGHGATVRYVTLPHESHGYAARESVLHVVAEMLNWCDTHLEASSP